MSEVHEHIEGKYHIETGFPWTHIIGYILSLALTFAALWFVVSGNYGHSILVTGILILGVFQVFVQLFFFMHITESHGPRYHVSYLVVSAVFVIAVVAGSIWIMTFGGTLAY